MFDKYDCIDIGGDVNSLSWARAYLGAKRPLGINIEPVRLERMRDAGDDCMDLNAFDIPLDIKPDWVIMSHFLEHLNSRDEVIEMVLRASNWAQKGVIINGPYFEDDDYIRSYGFKFAWGDWIDHDSRYSISTFYSALAERFDEGDLSISVGFPALSSAADNIFPLAEAPNKNSYETDHTVEKPVVAFKRPAFQEFAVIISKNVDVDPTAISVARHGKPGIAAYKLLQLQAHRALHALYT
ncbi:MAG: hypothetical protein JWR80_8029 [Bradyrhizobium sp.]|nr:hypothetical protein [Bradyrhizobium sp.]